MVDYLPFQRRFLRAAFEPECRTAALSIPRGNGKSTLCGELLADCLTPGHRLNRPGAEYVLVAASIEQARFVFRPIRDRLAADRSYSFVDSQRSLGVTHRPSRTRLRVQSSSAKTAMGLVGVPLVVADEPGSWETAGGQLMADAIQTAQGKPGSALRVVYIGTLAPAGVPGHWWHSLIDAGSGPSVHVTALRGELARWDDTAEIRRCNPLMWRHAESRTVLLDERESARRDSRLRARFLSYRLNAPSSDEARVLLTVEDWERTIARPVPERSGRPVVGVDLGGGRAWSAAAAVWPNGRCEGLAVAPGIPDLAAQEKRDGVPQRTYEDLMGAGGLRIAEGLRVPNVGQVVAAIRGEWGVPALILCDRFRLAELRDARPGCAIEPRVTRWSEAADDIRGLRKMAADGPLSVPRDLQPLIAAALAVSEVKNDDQGNVRLVKKGINNTGRDDVAAALCLAAGYASRRMGKPKKRPRVLLAANA